MQPSLLRYSPVAVVLHWAMAAVIVYELGVGLVMERIANPHWRIPIVQLHASLGVLLLGLSLARVAWRLGHRPPPLDPHLEPWEARLAHAVHLGLYGLMLIMPLIGWSILSTSQRALKSGQFLFYSPVRWPALPIISRLQEPRLDAAHAQFVQLHTLGGFVMIGLLVAHIAGAAKHQWFDGQAQFERMTFGRGPAARV